MEGDASWSLGTLFGLPIAFALMVIFVLLAIWFRRKSIEEGDDRYGDAGLFKWISRVSWAAVVIVPIATAISMYPWSSEYHQWVTKQGKIENISSRLFGSSDSFQQRFVVRFEDGREFACDDTRCAILRKGDLLTLACKRHWQYAGQDGYDCNFIRSERPE